MRLEHQGQRGASFIPDAIIVAAEHLEPVMAGRNIVVIGRATRAGIDPTGINALQLVLETILLGRLKAQRRVMDFKLSAAGRQAQKRRWRMEKGGWRQRSGIGPILDAPSSILDFS